MTSSFPERPTDYPEPRFPPALKALQAAQNRSRHESQVVHLLVGILLTLDEILAEVGRP